MDGPEVHVLRTPDEVAQAFASRFIAELAGLQSDDRIPSVVLTGGSIAVKCYVAVAGSPDRDAVDWSRVDFWFGDERFVERDSADRNAVPAADAMLDRLPVSPSRVHQMPATDDEYGDDVDAAAAAYADEVRQAATDGDTPVFDILILGIGPDGHCASLFPGRDELYDERPVVAVRSSPKPPPTRISLTMASLRRAHEVWWVAAGDGKAQAVHDALSGADPREVPAAGPKGMSRTLWLLDDAAASML